MLEIVYHSGMAFVSTLGFAVFFGAPRRALLACALTGVMGYLARQFALDQGMAMPGASFLGAAVIGLIAEILAPILRLPSTIFITTGFVPLLPGVAAVRAMYQVLAGDYAHGGPNAISVALNTAALAAGIGGLGAAARALRQHHEGLRS